MFSSYLNLPEETRASFTEDGWFLTGDLGEINAEGFLEIRGRKKDLLITSTGKNISPRHIEEILESNPLIRHAVVLGDGEKYLSCLIGLDFAQARQILAKEKASLSDEAITLRSEIKEQISQIVADLNQNLSEFEKIRDFRIITEDLDDTELLTLSGKVKRFKLIERFDHLHRAIYNSKAL
jgi:long-chain acyl-CoA synthetase